MGERRGPSRWWATAALIPLVPFLLIGRYVDSEYLPRLYFAGDPCRWLLAARDATDSVEFCNDGMIVLAAPDLADQRMALLLDLAFAATFAVVGYLLLTAGHRHWAPLRRRGDRWLWSKMPWIAVVAGTLDLIETSGQLIWLDDATPPTVATHLIAAIAWWKWAAYLLAFVGWFGLVIGPIAAGAVRPGMTRLLGDEPQPPAKDPVDERYAGEQTVDEQTVDEQPDGSAESTASDVLGITASGGGIRSASVVLGALRGLSRDGTFQRARWLHAVSGGGFAAGGWRASSLPCDDIELFEPDHPWMRSVKARLRYLDNGFGSLLGGIVGVIVRTVIVFGSVVWAAMLTGWVVGWSTGSWAVVPGFSNKERVVDGEVVAAMAFSDVVSWRQVLPGALPAALGLVVLAASLLSADPSLRRRARSVAVAVGGLGLALLIALVGLPVAIWAGRDVMSIISGEAETNVTILGVVTGAGLAAAVWRVLKSELTKRWSRLGGVFLLVGMFAFAGKVADDRANLDGVFAGLWVPVIGIVWLVATDLIPSHRLTLNGIYRKRLAGTFLLTAETDETHGAGLRVPMTYWGEPTWEGYVGARGPELVLCGTAQSTVTQHGGLPALGFAFSPVAMSLYDETSGLPAARYIPGSSWQGFPRRWTVSRSMALAGAAFSSAMGRQSFGSTNSLLAAVNLRLGMWVPNPNRRTWFAEEHPPPRVHLGYFAKELFNRYDPDDDAFVYVTDGGHRDNLGLVEQLRERPDRIIVLDASGDRRGSFATLRQAIALADIELNVQIDLEWDPITWPEHDVPTDCATTGTATFRDGSEHVTRLVYAKAQISDSAPHDLRLAAGRDLKFPDYSTGDQFLTPEQFDDLVALGEHLATRITRLL